MYVHKWTFASFTHAYCDRQKFFLTYMCYAIWSSYTFCVLFLLLNIFKYFRFFVIRKFTQNFGFWFFILQISLNQMWDNKKLFITICILIFSEVFVKCFCLYEFKYFWHFVPKISFFLNTFQCYSHSKFSLTILCWKYCQFLSIWIFQ